MHKKLRWYIAGLLLLATFVNYLDRQTLSVAAPELRRIFHMSNEDYGHIVSAFLLAYGLMQPLAGRIIDWLNTRRGYSVAVIWWSLACVAHAFAGGVASFSVCRVLLGIGEAGNFPAAIKTVSEWFPDKEKSIATGIFNVGAGLGALIAPPLIVFIIQRFGWREVFVFTGLAGSLWVVLWLLFYHSPEKHPWLSKEEFEYIKSGQQVETDEEIAKGCGLWKEMREKPRMLANLLVICFARVMTDSVWLFWVFWLPSYLKDARHLSLVQIGAIAWIPFLVSDFGSLIGGWLSPFFIKRGVNVLQSRKLALIVSSLLMPASILVSHVSLPIAIACASLCALGHQMWASTILTLPADLFPKRMVGSAFGWTGAAGNLGGMLSVTIIGMYVDKVGYSPVLFVAGWMHPIAAVIILLTISMPWVKAVTHRS